VNGKKRPVLRVNKWHTGVLVPAGKHRVELEYRPSVFWALMVVNRITIVSVLVVALFAVM
jgi:uncharacterized membrane protein YfhO